MSFCFNYESCDTLKSFTLFITVKTIMKLNLGHGDKFEIKIQKISRRGSRSPDKAKSGHFTFFFRGRQRNVPRITMHVHSHCIAHCSVTFSLPLPSWFRKLPISKSSVFVTSFCSHWVVLLLEIREMWLVLYSLIDNDPARCYLSTENYS